MNVLIVESAAKSRTLQKYLGTSWRVVATGGHVQTLPEDKALYGKAATNDYWANRPGQLPEAPWVWTETGEQAVRKILKAGGDDPIFWIATDPDREGEFIAWCLERLLRPHGDTRRVTFQEVTREAIRAALEQPRPISKPMVESALVRKFLDRLVGYRASKTARASVGPGASMGRVQTPTLGFVVERELERERFVPTPYFEVRALAGGVTLRVRFHDGDDAARWRDAAGHTDLNRTFDAALAQRALTAVTAAGKVVLGSVQARTSSRKPQPPFTTDALLQEAGARFGWSPKKTNALASQLYESGHVTYIRTDSTRLAASAVDKARALVEEAFGKSYLGAVSRENVAAGHTQDAHEAIRPTRLEQSDVELDDSNARRLYRLIRARTLASQMRSSESASRSVTALCERLDRPLTGSLSWRTFPGWEAAYSEFEPTRPTLPPNLPLEAGAVWPLDPASADQPNPVLIEDATKPPPRYRGHSLIKAMKDAGIGRPSTYSSTLDKLLNRTYLVSEDGALAPTERGRALWTVVAPLYAPAAAADSAEDPLGQELFSTAFTASMEDGLDQVALGERSAAERWETWRDQVRTLHRLAQARRKAGASTPRQHDLLQRLIANAPADPDLPGCPADLTMLTFQDAQALIARLREAGIEPAPSQAQLDAIARLLEELALTEAERHALTGVADTAEIVTSAQAGRIIEALRRLHDERMPPSAKQRRFIDELQGETATSDAEAAALVGLASLGELTGGRGGTASALIEVLKSRVGRQAASDK